MSTEEDKLEEAPQESSDDVETPEGDVPPTEEADDDPLERSEKEGGNEAEFDLDAQIHSFRQDIENDPDNCIHHYNLAEALEEWGDHEEARIEYELALQLDKEKDFHAIIHFGLGNMLFQQLLSGIQSVVVKSSVGLHSAHKPGDSITQVTDEDYTVPLSNFEQALEHLSTLKADEDLVDYISKEVPGQMASLYYKWASDLIDKSRQIALYGDEVQDVKKSLKLLKKSLDIDPNHSQANMMVGYAKKMLAEGWKSYDEYGFEAKSIDGSG